MSCGGAGGPTFDLHNVRAVWPADDSAVTRKVLGHEPVAELSRLRAKLR